MRNGVDIIRYWIKELRKVREFQELAKVWDIEFKRLYGETQRAEDNQYIHLADEYGIRRLEKVAGIYPKDTDTLDQRRTRLLSYWNDRKPYTLSELKNRIRALCGSNDFEVDMDYPNFFIHILTHVGGYGVFEEIGQLLDYFLPANLVLEFENLCKGEGSAPLYFGVGTTTLMSYTVTNDVNASYPLTEDIFLAAPVSLSAAHIVTNDIQGQYSSTLDFKAAVGLSGAAQATITNDINSKAELSEGKTVGEAVSSSTIITLS